MDYRLFLISLLLGVPFGRVSGHDRDHEGVMRAATRECCPHFETRWEEYGHCVVKHGFVPVCDGSRKGCYYDNRFYKVGEVVEVIPSKCLKLLCSRVTVNSKTLRSEDNAESITDEGQIEVDNTDMVQITMVHEGYDCGCCEYNGKLYQNGSTINLNRHVCDPKVCVDGKWTDHSRVHTYYDNLHGGGRFGEKSGGDEDQDTEGSVMKPMKTSNDRQIRPTHMPGHLYHHCCYYYGQYYADGEIIAVYNQSYGSNCYKVTCRSGYTYTIHYDCCCSENGEIYPCDSSVVLPSSDHETCHIRRCCDGLIETHHEPGCCFSEGQVYKLDQFVGYTSNGCQKLMCRNGGVVPEDAGRCCHVDGEYYTYNQIVEVNTEKCILKVCIGTTVVDRSVDHCPCCMYNKYLYVEGYAISPSPCQTLRCLGGNWVPDCKPTKCHYCYVGSHFKTFDNTSYHHNALCDYTLVQNSYYSYHSSTINLSFKKCSVPFNNILSCPDQLTIKHNSHTMVVISSGGSIKVNGVPVDSLPYQGNNNLFIYQTAFAYNVITFQGLVVEYGKGDNPSVRVMSPTWNYNKLFGLCGYYNGFSRDDLRQRSSHYYTSSVSTFVKSWKTPYTSCIRGERTGTNCSTIDIDQLNEIKSWCSDLYEKYLCLDTTLNEDDFEDACVEYMCSCIPGEEQDCKADIVSKYHTDCANLGGIPHFVCNETATISTSSSTTTPATSTSSSVINIRFLPISGSASATDN